MIASLSLNARGPSRISATGLLHVSPPSVDRLTVIALAEPAPNVAPLNASAAWYAVPSGANVTHGSVARW